MRQNHQAKDTQDARCDAAQNGRDQPGGDLSFDRSGAPHAPDRRGRKHALAVEPRLARRGRLGALARGLHHSPRVEDCLDIGKQDQFQIFVGVSRTQTHCDLTCNLAPFGADGIGYREQDAPIIGNSIFELFRYFRVTVKLAPLCPIDDVATHDVEIVVIERINRILRADLLDALLRMEGQPWAEYCGVQGDETPRRLSVRTLSGLLEPFGIKSRTVWPLHRTADTRSGEGFYRAQFEETWRSYLPEDDTTHSNVIKALASG
jgi:Protein of unknown function (DUF3631)